MSICIIDYPIYGHYYSYITDVPQRDQLLIFNYFPDGQKRLPNREQRSIPELYCMKKNSTVKCTDRIHKQNFQLLICCPAMMITAGDFQADI